MCRPAPPPVRPISVISASPGPFTTQPMIDRLIGWSICASRSSSFSTVRMTSKPCLAQDGQEPWCVQTCPSGALKFGPRESMLTLARERAALLGQRFASARVYGETQLGGLGALFVLPDQPSALGLPEQPTVPASVTAWQRAVQPLTQGITGLSLVTTALAFVFARRHHRLEKQALHAQAQHEEDDHASRR